LSTLINLSRWRKSRRKYWVRALIAGVLLAGEFHLFAVEIFHHHTEVIRFCQLDHQGGSYLHAAPDLNLLCPFCQAIRNSSVRPAVKSAIQRPVQQAALLPVTRPAHISLILPSSLLARAPPLA